jgi:preprotein translocase subunit SecF
MARQLKDRFDAEADALGARPVRTTIRWGIVALTVAVVLILVAGVVSFGLRWLNAGAEVAGSANVKGQYAAVIEDWNALEAAAANSCGAVDAGSEEGATFLEDPAFAYKAQYRHIAVDFSRRQQNIFEAEIVGPSGYPRMAPRLAEMEAQVCG